jgi:hypothetical protein
MIISFVKGRERKMWRNYNREEDHSEIDKRKEYQERFCLSEEENGEELQFLLTYYM